jgi:hypothetical protein
MLFNINPLKSTEQVRNEVKRIIARQKKGSRDDLTPFGAEIDKLLSYLEFKPEWKKLPVVARVALVDTGEKSIPYFGDVVMPNTKHDLDLVIKMLNYMREQKKLNAIKMPLFVQPDEISLSYREGKFSNDGGKISSQISIILQKGAIMYLGFVFGSDYVILQG